MTNVQRKTATRHELSSRAAVSASDRIRPWLVGIMTALLVARPLLPSEGVSWIGDGQPLDLAWLVLASLVGIWIAVCAPKQIKLALQRWSAVDTAVASLIMLVWISAANSAGREGSPRFLMNMCWELTSLGLVYFLTRHLVARGIEARTLVAIMLALAVVESCYGYYQVYVSLPADRAAYAADPDTMLRASGQWHPPGSPERARFESRLASTEPLATFALTNSLAGFLAPWLIVGIGILLSIGRSGAVDGASSSHRAGASALWVNKLGLAICLTAIAGCLLLTKSRSAYLAVVVGLVAFPLTLASLRKRIDRRLVMAACIVLVLAVAAALLGRGLDPALWTEAGKSLGYRLEYWQSTLSMIRNHFWFGVGPGNFQDFYTQYKLPQASEEIRDPHNMFFEFWATCGTLAVVAFSVALVGTLWRAWTAERRETPATSESAGTTDCRRSQVVMLVGAAAGFVTAFLLGPLVGMVLSEEQLLAGLVLSGIVAVIVWPWIRQGNLTSRLAALGLVVLSVHLLAAGGIAFPGVAYSFWLLAAITLNAAEPQPVSSTELTPREARRLRAVAVSLAIVAAGGALACYVFAFRPMVAARAAMARAEELALSDAQSPSVRVLWLEAAAADPWLSEPWAALAELELRRVRRNPNDTAARQRFASSVDELLQNRKHSSTVMRQIGLWYDELDEIEHDPETVRTATSYLRRATALYPNSATIRGEYALVLIKNERTTEARRQARIALDLDATTPHVDKKLPAELKAKLESLLSAKVAPAATER